MTLARTCLCPLVSYDWQCHPTVCSLPFEESNYANICMFNSFEWRYTGLASFKNTLNQWFSVFLTQRPPVALHNIGSPPFRQKFVWYFCWQNCLRETEYLYIKFSNYVSLFDSRSFKISYHIIWHVYVFLSILSYYIFPTSRLLAEGMIK